MSELTTDQACAVIDDGIAEIKRLRADLAEAKRLLRRAQAWANPDSRIYSEIDAFLSRASDGGA